LVGSNHQSYNIGSTTWWMMNDRCRSGAQGHLPPFITHAILERTNNLFIFQAYQRCLEGCQPSSKQQGTHMPSGAAACVNKPVINTFTIMVCQYEPLPHSCFRMAHVRVSHNIIGASFRPEKMRKIPPLLSVCIHGMGHTDACQLFNLCVSPESLDDGNYLILLFNFLLTILLCIQEIS